MDSSTIAPPSRALFRDSARWRRVARTILYPVVSLGVFVGIWAAAVWIFDINPFVLPSPSAVWDSFFTWKHTLLDYARVTLVETLLGFACAAGAGLMIGMGLAFSARARASVYPLLVASQMVPKVALAPIFLVWFGVGLASKVTIAFLVAFFPIVVSTTLGMGQVQPEMVRLFRSMRSRPLQTFVKLRLPMALPSIFAGMKVAMTLAVVGAIVGEFVGADSGLGYFVIFQSGQLDTAAVYAGLVTVTIMGVALYFVLELIERLISPHRPDQIGGPGATTM